MSIQALNEQSSMACAALLAELGNGKRLQIFGLLIAEGEIGVGEICKRISLSQSATSQHLMRLRAVNLVQARRDRQNVYYRCESEAVRSVYQTICSIASTVQGEPLQVAA